MNPIEFVDKACARNPLAPCLIDGVTGRVRSYAEARDFTMRVAGALRDRPQVRRVGILSPNDVTAFLVQLGCFRAAVVTVSGNSRYTVADNAAIFTRFEIDILFLHPTLTDLSAAMREALPHQVEIVDLGDGVDTGFIGIDAWCDVSPWQGVDVQDSEQPYTIQPTGGTTGLPKGVLLPVREAHFAVESLLLLAPSNGTPVFLAAVPLTHAAGKIANAVFAQGGCCVVLPSAEPKTVLATIERWKVTQTFLPPTVIYGLLDCGEVDQYDLGSLQYLFYGAAPIAPKRLADAIRSFGPVLAQVYGQTESGLPNTYLSPEDHLGPDGQPADLRRLAAAGRVNPLCQLAILDEHGIPVEPGMVGEIAVRGAGVMLGYCGDEAATAATKRDGWHVTGDLARIDEDGFVYIVDRAKDLIISGGFNVYPAEVERVINTHGAVADCAVIGIPDSRWGEAVTAVIEMKPGASVNDIELIALCKERIGSLKAPKSVVFVDRLPRSAVGKVLKNELRKRFWCDKERMI